MPGSPACWCFMELPMPRAGLIDLYGRAVMASDRTGGAVQSCQLRRRGWAAGQLCDALPTPPRHGAEPRPRPRSQIPGGGRGPRWVGRLRGGPRRGAGGPPSPRATFILAFFKHHVLWGASPAAKKLLGVTGDAASPCPSCHGGRPRSSGYGAGLPGLVATAPAAPAAAFCCLLAPPN